MERMNPLPFALSIAPAALSRLRVLFAQHPGHDLRVEVRGGGCSGLEYLFSLDTDPSDDDWAVAVDDRRVVVDPVSAPYLEGATMDYVESFAHSQFVFQNPQAKATCGCGKSFAA